MKRRRAPDAKRRRRREDAAAHRDAGPGASAAGKGAKTGPKAAPEKGAKNGAKKGTTKRADTGAKPHAQRPHPTARPTHGGEAKARSAPGRQTGTRNRPHDDGPRRGQVTGTVIGHPDGFAFVRAEDGGGDVHVPARGLHPAVHGDRVAVRLASERRGPGRSGRVVRVLERRDAGLIGVLHRGRGVVVVVPREAGFATPVVVERGHDGGARDGQLVAARIVRWPGDADRFVGVHVERVLGAADDLQSETAAILASHGLPTAFPPAVAAAARRLPTDGDLAERRDLRALPLVTIDGERARDFDDAIHVARHGRGYRLTVAVADVAHYVPAGSAIDLEARARGTSVYFPDRVVPMLPPELSEDRCSLRPHEDRLCQVVLLDCDAAGAVVGADFADAVMRSAARLTYPQVRRALVDREPDVRTELAPLLPSLEAAAELAERLLARRRARGALDFDLPEPEIVVDLRGQPEHILRAERSLAHRIVEECMLAANEAVARELARRGVPSLHRVHEPPPSDAVTALARFLHDLGLRLEVRDGTVTPRALQRVLDAMEGRPEVRLVHTVLLRSMSQARYAAEPLGHFGLAAEHYTHFTSPIRRYPDLVVHRLLRRVRHGQGPLPDDLAAIAAEASQRERVAVDAERDVVALWRVAAMQSRVGEEHAGVISGIAPFGCFVELSDVFVEGLIHVRELPPDRWEHDPAQHVLCGRRSGRRLRVGQPVRVVVTAAVPARRQIDLVLAQSEAPTPRWSRSRARSRRS